MKLNTLDFLNYEVQGCSLLFKKNIFMHMIVKLFHI